MLFDSHTHLNDDKLFEKLDEVINQALTNDVSFMLCVGYDKVSSERALKIASMYPSVYAAIGFHPTEAKEVTEEDFVWFESHLQDERVKAIGEIGLDYYWDDSFKDVQKDVFKRQIDLAKKYHLPISIHMRDALEDTLNILKKEASPDLTGVMHCYSGSTESAKEFIKVGMMISLGGPVTFKNARVPKEVAKNIDLEFLLIETDAPYLAPHPFRGKENSPALLKYTAMELAELKEMSYEEIAEATTNNAKRLFHI